MSTHKYCKTCRKRLPDGYRFCSRRCVETYTPPPEPPPAEPPTVECIADPEALEQCSEVQLGAFWTVAEFVARKGREPSHDYLRDRFPGTTPEWILSVLRYRGLIRTILEPAPPRCKNRADHYTATRRS